MDTVQSSSSKRVLVMLSNMERGGLSLSVLNQVTFLKNNGYEPVVVSAGGELTVFLSREKIKHIQLPIHTLDPFHFVSNFKRLKSVVKEMDISFIHVHSRPAAVLAKTLSRSCKIPVVSTVHSVFDDRPWFGLRRYYNRFIYKADQVIVHSDFMKYRVLDKCPFLKGKVTKIPGFLNLSVFNSNWVSSERLIDLATRWNVIDGVPLITAFGSVLPSKGYDILINAFALLKKQDISFQALIVGPHLDHKYVEKLRSRIKELDLQGFVSFIEKMDDRPVMLKVSDVVVSPSVWPEGFSRQAIECLAMGRPFVGSNHGAVSELVHHDLTGKLVKPGHSRSLADGLKWALSLNGKQREKLAALGLEQVKGFDQSVVLKQLLSVYKRVLN